MKTTSDLKAQLPALISYLKSQKHEIGVWYEDTDMDEDGERGCIISNPAVNEFVYEEDGWLVEGEYECIGKLESEPSTMWSPGYEEIGNPEGGFTWLSAYHYDEETNEATDFTDEDVNEIWDALNVALNESL